MSNATEKEVGRLQVQGHDILIVQVDFPGEPALWDLYVDTDCLTEDSSLDHYPTAEDAERLLEWWLLDNEGEA